MAVAMHAGYIWGIAEVSCRETNRRKRGCTTHPKIPPLDVRRALTVHAAQEAVVAPLEALAAVVVAVVVVVAAVAPVQVGHEAAHPVVGSAPVRVLVASAGAGYGKDVGGAQRAAWHPAVFTPYQSPHLGNLGFGPCLLKALGQVRPEHGDAVLRLARRDRREACVLYAPCV